VGDSHASAGVQQALGVGFELAAMVLSPLVAAMARLSDSPQMADESLNFEALSPRTPNGK
jgi:hypothetical protein